MYAKRTGLVPVVCRLGQSDMHDNNRVRAGYMKYKNVKLKSNART